MPCDCEAGRCWCASKPDCEKIVAAASVVPDGIRIEPGAATCSCFPANKVCPSATRCTTPQGCSCENNPQGLPSGHPKCGPDAPDPIVRDVAPTLREGHPGYLRLLSELRTLHSLKSGGYGNGADKFANFTAVAGASGEPRYLYPVLRSIEKLTRVLSLHAQGRVGELSEELLDVSSLMLCAEAMRREDV